MSITINCRVCWNHKGIAALAGAAPNKMLQWLRAHGYLRENNLPVRTTDRRDWFEVTKAQQWDTMTTYWTERGMKEIVPVVTAAVACGEIPRRKGPVYKDEPPQGVVEFWGDEVL